MSRDGFPQRLQRLRIARGLSQNSLQLAMGMAPVSTSEHVGRWERGESAPSFDNLILLADALSVTLDALMREAAPETHVLPFVPGAMPIPGCCPPAMGFAGWWG